MYISVLVFMFTAVTSLD